MMAEKEYHSARTDKLTGHPGASRQQGCLPKAAAGLPQSKATRWLGVEHPPAGPMDSIVAPFFRV